MLMFVRMRFRESCRVLAMPTVVIVAMNLACTNVVTDKGSEAQGRGVLQGHSTVSAGGSSGFVNASDGNEPDPCDDTVCGELVIPAVDPAQSDSAAQASPADERTALQWESSDVNSTCRLLLDDAGSGLTEQDVVIEYYADAEGDTPAVSVAWTPSSACSPSDTAVVPPADAGATPPDAGVPPSDTLPPSADGGGVSGGGGSGGGVSGGGVSGGGGSGGGVSGGGVDGGPNPDAGTSDNRDPITTIQVPRVVDLAEEGAYLDHASDGTWLTLCPNACYTLQTQGGLLLLSVPYRVNPAAAR